ncbi:hypothetical protein C943_01372 [Mariniradius saccharolyticus AK6]|uniref:Putative restriction endonuclease domain-containing protein n=1 Tax=Mariniradius saccharolyticus AK6 TaxID=1239962 RepID=M7X3P0_9BACT|nr:Uma2 family endonuclease [Mariniradius saccharolyticus]EMS32110.1 hypothetical protein C943_01372 [Mariniradius saccharolyticus AK6]
MDIEEKISKVEEPSAEYGVYTYEDYLSWNLDVMVELIKGKIFKKAAAAPRRRHQGISGNVFSSFHSFLKGKKCKVYEAPFDVRLPVKSKKNKDIHTVVQPDICVICDPSKLDDFGCIGAPDLIIEILSPGNNQLELTRKYDVYQESGVREYWIIHPDEHTLLVYTLVDGFYQPSRLMTHGDVVKSIAVPGFELELGEVFRDLD